MIVEAPSAVFGPVGALQLAPRGRPSSRPVRAGLMLEDDAFESQVVGAAEEVVKVRPRITRDHVQHTFGELSNVLEKAATLVQRPLQQVVPLAMQKIERDDVEVAGDGRVTPRRRRGRRSPLAGRRRRSARHRAPAPRQCRTTWRVRAGTP